MNTKTPYLEQFSLGFPVVKKLPVSNRVNHSFKLFQLKITIIWQSFYSLQLFDYIGLRE